MPTDVPNIIPVAASCDDNGSVLTSKSLSTKMMSTLLPSTKSLLSRSSKLSEPNPKAVLPSTEFEGEEVAVVGVKKTTTKWDAKAGDAKKAKTEVIEADEYGIPKSTRHFKIGGKFVTAPALTHNHKLAKSHYQKFALGTVTMKNDGDVDDGGGEKLTSKGKTKKKIVLFAPKRSNKTFGNICLMCLRVALQQRNTPPAAWTATLCNVKENLSSADKHLQKAHSNEPKIIQYIAKQQEKKEKRRKRVYLHWEL